MWVVNGVFFYLNWGEMFGIVGEFGCGKSVMVLLFMCFIFNLLGRIESGIIIFEGCNFLNFIEEEMCNFCGNEIFMIF